MRSRNSVEETPFVYGKYFISTPCFAIVPSVTFHLAFPFQSSPIKIASNDALANKKPHWIDFNAYGFNTEEKANDLLEIIKQVANGKETQNEKYGCREIAIFKDGVTL